MSDSEGSDSDGSYGGRKKMRRDEAEEVTPLIQFVFYSCRVRRRTLQMSRSLKGKILLEEMGRMTVMRRCFLATMCIVEPYYGPFATLNQTFFHRTVESTRRRGGGPMQGTSS